MSPRRAPEGPHPRGVEAALRHLPEDDSPRALSPEDRALVASSFARRAQAELDAAAAFARVTRGLFALGLPRDLLWLSARAVTDELRHAELCGAVAVHYAQGPLELRPPRDEADVRFGDADEATSRVLLALAQAAFSESLGAAFLSAALEEATAPLARAVTRELLGDELDHARLGFALLARVKPEGELGGHVGRALPTLTRLACEAWRAALDTTPERVPAGHGLVDRATARRAVEGALHGVVLAGFAEAGFPIAEASQAARL